MGQQDLGTNSKSFSWEETLDTSWAYWNRQQLSGKGPGALVDKLNMSQQRVSYQRLTASWDVLTEAIIHFYTAVFGHHLECCSVSSFPRHTLPNTRKMP